MGKRSAQVELFHYRLGNILRGYVEGDFASDVSAWYFLSREFDKHFPSSEGRLVHMEKIIQIKHGNTRDEFS